MNYRHHFHAGNFADVFKHVILVCMLEKLQEKPTALTYLDTHAGRGLYYLNTADAQKLKEYEFGIQALLDYSKHHPIPVHLKKYIDIIARDIKHVHHKMIYPGSPKIAEAFMREQDKMILCELHPEELKFLKENMYRQDRLIALHHSDAYAAMKAFLPPKTARGLVLVDPPFEKRNEFSMIDTALQHSLKRWRQGHYIVWYPIKDKHEVRRFQKNVLSLSSETQFIEFFIKNKAVTSHLMGCGVALINSPWKLDEVLSNEVLPYLAEAMQGSFRMGSFDCLS